MAVRARLTAPREARRDWPWHTVKSASLPASLLFAGARRLEAEGLLASGFGTRRAIQAKRSGWVPFEEIARAWQPPRLRGIQVSPKFGTPFSPRAKFSTCRPYHASGCLWSRQSTRKNDL